VRSRPDDLVCIVDAKGFSAALDGGSQRVVDCGVDASTVEEAVEAAAAGRNLYRSSQPGCDRRNSLRRVLLGLRLQVRQMRFECRFWCRRGTSPSGR
jgi:hypothetical protein